PGHHHHALPAAVRHVVHLEVTPRGMVAELVQRHVEDTQLARPLEGPHGERSAEQLGEEGDDVRAQRQSSSPGSGPLRTRGASWSMPRTTSATTGIRCSRVPARPSHTSWMPFAITPAIVPTTAPSTVSTVKPSTS